MSKTSKTHIKTGDTVQIIAGNDKGKIGKVTTVFPKAQKAIIQGHNFRTHYIKANQKQPKGGIQKKEAPIHISNLMFIDPATNQPTRIGRKLNTNNKLQRYSKKTGQLI